eukprot:14114_1
MGNCFADVDNDDLVFQGFRNDVADNEMDYEKICLLGLSGSGKSTLYLNLRQLYNDISYDHEEQLKHCAAIVRSNCLLYIAVLINEADKLFEKTQNDLYLIDYQNKSIHDAIQLITKYIPYKFDAFTPMPPPTPTPVPVRKEIPKPLMRHMHQAKSSRSTPLPVVEEKKITLEINDDDSERQPLTIDQVVIDSASFVGFNIDDQSHTPGNESKNMMDDEDGSYLTIENANSNNIQTIVEIPRNSMAMTDALPVDVEREEEKQVQYAEELAFLMNEYDEYGFFDEMGIDVWNYGTQSNWKNKFNAFDHKGTKVKKAKHTFEAYKPFDFDAFYKKQKEWEKQKQSDNKKSMKHFDEESEYSSEGVCLEELLGLPRPVHARRANNNNNNDKLKVLNEELIDDFGAYFEYIKANHTDEKKEIKPWKDFGHKAAMVSHYFDMKLNDTHNPIKHEHQFIGHTQWWRHSRHNNNAQFTMKKLEIVLQNKTKIARMSQYDSEGDTSDDEEDDIETPNGNNNNANKIEIVEGKIKKKDDWDHQVMNNKEVMLTQLTHTMQQQHSTNTINTDVINALIELKEEKEDISIDMDRVQSVVVEEQKDDEEAMVEVNGEAMSIRQFWNDMKKLGESIKKLWNLPAIQQIYLKRYNVFYMPSNMDYWLYNSTKIFSPYFKATNQHLSLHRNYCTKIQSFKNSAGMSGPKIKVFDIPATTPEIRDKYWNREYCANSDAVIFTVSLVDIFHVSFENPSKNAFYLSIELFYQMLHSKWLNKGCKIILFLTHRDRLIEYIRNGHSIRSFAAHFTSWRWRPDGVSTVLEHKSKSVDKTVNTIDAMQNTFERFIQSMEEKDNKHHKDTISTYMDTSHKERDGTITKFEIENNKLMMSSEEELKQESEEEEMELKMEQMIALTSEKKEEQKDDMIVACKCPQGHALEMIVCDTSNAYVCDYCREDLVETMHQYQCRIDNYDLCDKCHSMLLLMEREKVKKEMQRTPVWMLDEYEGVEYMDRMMTPQSDAEREREQMLMNENVAAITPDSKDRRITPDSNENTQQERENKILFQFKKQTKKTNKTNDKNHSISHDENWKYILSGSKKLTYDGSAFDDQRWLIQAYDGYCEWIRDSFIKCKDPNDHRTIHCHTLNLVHQDDIEKVMYDLNNYVFTSFHNDWMF